MKYLFLTLQIILIILLILAFGAFVGVLFCECIETYVVKLLDLEKKDEALKFLGISMGGILVALQAMMSYRRAKAMEDAVEKTEQGQRQDRLKNAIEHLGKESESVRIGGAYELFHLAQDTPDTPELRQTVHDILCAHIRQTTGEKGYQEKHKSKPSEEVQTLLNLLFQEPAVFKGLRANLRGSWLKGASLRDARLEDAVLVGVNLQGAKLYKAQLKRAGLYKAQMQGAELAEARMQEANLMKAQLQGVELMGAWMQETNLIEAQMQGARLVGTQMQEAGLYRAQMQGTRFVRTQMQGAGLAEAQMQGAVLREAQMQGAVLMGVQMQGVTTYMDNSASFEERIRNQIGQEGDLTGIIFEGGLSQEELDSIVADFPNKKGIETLRKKLVPHIDKLPSNRRPKGIDVTIDTYSEEDAEKWITEYEQAMSEVPADDN